MREKFNLENLLAGKYERVETRSGKEVDDLAYLPKSAPYQLAGTVDDGFNKIDTWTIDGFYRKTKEEAQHDLFGILKTEQ